MIEMTSNLELVPIEIHKDKKHYIVEDLASGEFYEMPVVCIDAIKMIQGGTRLGDIEATLMAQYPKEEIDIIDFAGQLLELELIEEIDGVPVEHEPKDQQQLGYTWISPGAGKLFFNKCSLVFYFVLLIINLFLLISNPKLFPNYRDAFVSPLMVLNIPIWMIVTFILVLIHEFGHVLAIRSFNLPTKMGVGHRLFFVVLETDMSSAWKLPSKDRNILYLSGLCFDTVILFISLVGQLLFPAAPWLFHGILRMMVLDTFIRMVYQLCIYMKTDLYFIFENSTGCYNLMENAQQFLRGPFRITKKTTSQEEVIFEGERKTVISYAVFYLIGVGLTISLYLGFYLPQLFYAIKKVLPGFQKTPTSLPFWDAVLFIMQVLIGFLLLFYSWSKKYRQIPDRLQN